MTTTTHEPRDIRPGRQRVSLAVAIGLCLPGAVSRLADIHGNTGLMALVSVTLTDEWHELRSAERDPAQIGQEAQTFVQEWVKRFTVRHPY